MRFQRVEIENFKAVQRLTIDQLSDVVVIAGPNGCGKSSVFDAIRLWKSAHGGYQQNEVHHWFNEFQLGVDNASLLKVMADRTRHMRIAVEVELAESERLWLAANAEHLIRLAVWRQVAPQAVSGWRTMGTAGLAEDFRVHEPEVQSRVATEVPILLQQLESRTHFGEFILEPNTSLKFNTDMVLTRLFSTYEPEHLGIVDYHGPQRNYAREGSGGINLNLQSTDEQRSQSALYNYNNKYSNVKTELASAYVKDLISHQAGRQADDLGHESLIETLGELFNVFFPGKAFLGAQPRSDGRLDFTVRTAAGDHDIDDLSSGEKEVLYGYLRLRNSAPRNSVILLDEPELHLNPRLISGLPDFYYKHLGQALGNQLWLVTHSDALLRQSVGHAGFKVFHMQPPTLGGAVGSQAQEIRADEELEQVIIDLVGDLAAYRPGGKLVILEGGGESEVDLRIIQDLFPDFTLLVNLISGGNKRRVRDFHDLLERARVAGALPATVFSITDMDFDPEGADSQGHVLQWNRFHIENYLLEPRYILSVMRDLRVPGANGMTEGEVETALRESAEWTLAGLVRESLDAFANAKLVESIRTRSNPNKPRAAEASREVIETSLRRVQRAVDEELSLESLRTMERDETARLHEALRNDTWRALFRGRDILKRFVADRLRGTARYAAFRDLIVARMRDESHQPEGMKLVIDGILQA